MKKTTEELLKTLSDKRSIEDYLKDEGDELEVLPLKDFIAAAMDEKNLKKSDVIRNGNLDKKYAYQLFNGIKENPSRNKALMLAFGLGLNYKEAKKLLRCAAVGELYARSPRDSVIIYCLENKKSLITCNEYLSDYSLELLD